MFKFYVSILFAHSTGEKLRQVGFLKAFHKAFLTFGNGLAGTENCDNLINIVNSKHEAL